MILEDLIRRLTRLERFIDGLIKPEVSRWIDWTPTVTQSGAVTVTVTFARYVVQGNTVQLRASLAVTGTGTIANPVVIGGLPTPLSPVNVAGVVGEIRIFDSGTAFYVGSLEIFTATSFKGFAHLETDAIGVDPSFALANGDNISFQAAYERA